MRSWRERAHLHVLYLASMSSSNSSSDICVENVDETHCSHRSRFGSMSMACIRASRSLSDERNMLSIIYEFFRKNRESNKAFCCDLFFKVNETRRWASNPIQFQKSFEARPTRLVLNGRKHGKDQTKIIYYLPSGGQKGKPIPGGRFTSGDKIASDFRLTDWIVSHAQLSTLVEQNDFVNLVGVLGAEYDMKAHYKVNDIILTRWRDEKNRDSSLLDKDVGRRWREITTNMTTSATRSGHMMITVHYIYEQ